MKGKALTTKEVSVYSKLVFFIAFLVPIKILEDFIGFPIDNYLYVIPSLILFFVINSKRFQSGLVLIFSLSVFLVSLVNLQITPLHLLSLAVIYYICANFDFYKVSLEQTHSISIMGCLGMLIYSSIYFGEDFRFVHLGVKEINISGLGIFLLGVILYKEKKLLGKIILLAGFTTFSRNYALAVSIFIFLKWIMQRLRPEIANKVVKYFSFVNIAIVSCAILVGLSVFYQRLYDNGMILEYTEGGASRFLSFFEISNYHRFVVNTNVLYIYKEYPQLLFSGIPINEFTDYNLEVCRLNAIDFFSNDRPHNFFFSYLQIYGIYVIVIIMTMQRIFKKIVNKNNFCIFVPVMIYGIFLGMGLSGYWLFISVIALSYYYE